MKPLQAVAMGLVIVLLTARARGFDLVADPLGWVLVLHGVRRLPAPTPLRSTAWALAVLALAVSVPLWFPAVVDRIEDADEALLWAVTLPQLAFVAVLCTGLARAAAATNRRAAGWLRTAAGLTVVSAVLPAVVYGAGETTLLTTMVVVSTLALVVTICLLFAYSGRPWAGASRPTLADGQANGQGEEPRSGDATGAAPAERDGP